MKEIKNIYNGNSRVFFANYNNLISDFENSMIDIMQFAEVNITDTIKRDIKIQAEKQKSYKGTHKYSISDFGLCEDDFKSNAFS
jgi:predicted transcriptional regulator